jgi:isoquinoline 1-oxidoreductase alpha subunit
VAYTLTINEQTHSVDVDGDTPLLWVLRDVLGMTGTKFGCGVALCGACTVHLDGMAIRACITPVGDVGTAKISTIEALDMLPHGKALQEAWIELDVPQCGYCQSGQLMAAASLLSLVPKPSREEIDSAMAGNICRCGTYQRIRAAIERVSA